MDFIDRINELSARIPKQIDYCLTEEATKNAMVMPFINALGYDVFNPFEVVPEFVADVGIKKGEKIASSNGFCGQDFAPANEVEMSKLCNQLS